MTYPTKKLALAAAKSLREQGLKVKIFESSQVYTAPGKGIRVHIEYILKVQD